MDKIQWREKCDTTQSCILDDAEDYVARDVHARIDIYHHTCTFLPANISIFNKH